MNKLVKTGGLPADGAWADEFTYEPQTAGMTPWTAFQPRRVGKFEPPFYGFHLVSTSRTEDYLANDGIPKLTTVSAPTGYGKTTFLTRMYREWSANGQRCVWVTLDEADTSVVSLLNLLDMAVQIQRRAEDEAPLALPGEAVGRLDRIIHRLMSLGNPVLFLDNLHFCTDPGLPAVLDTLIFSTGENLRLVLASTAELSFDTGRARLELATVDIGPRDLSFDGDAVGDVLRDAGLGVPSADMVQLIVEKTEGWPAAVRLIQAVMAEEPDSERALRRFAGSDADLAAMLNKRLLARFDADLVSFLLDLSHLRIFSAELALAATRHPRAAEWINYLVQRNALISALDRHRTWFRFHALFRDYLLVEAKRSVPEERRQALLDRAATWCFANGHTEDAANYALSAPAPALVREILESSARSIVSDRGDLALYLDWVGRAQDLGVEIGVNSEFWYAWALAFSRRCTRAQQRAANLEQRLRAMPADAPCVKDLGRRLELLRVMLYVVSDDMDAAYSGATQWLRVEKARSPIYTMTAALAAATSLLPSQNYAETRKYIQIAQVALNHVAGGNSHAWMATTKSLLDLEQGNPAAAEQILIAAQKKAVDLIGPQTSMVAMLATLRARALCDMGRLDEAQAILRTALLPGVSQGFVDTTRHGLEAAIALYNGDGAGPFTMAELETIAFDGPPRLQRMFAAVQIRCLCMQGDIERAVEIAGYANIDINLENEHCLPVEALAVMLAKIDLLIAQNRVKVAQRLAEQTLRQVTALDRRREMVDLHLIIARLHMLVNDQKSSVRAVSRAITLAAPRGLVQPFLHHQRSLREILATARLKDLALTLNEQIKIFEVICEKTGIVLANAAGAAPSASGDLETLTRREIEMLLILESGPSNQQMADQLLVSVQTVKWHLYNLYAKLGVKNRAAALAKARALSLLSR
jgi:LuxR family maltose regulon positive regulatory protein